jgi:hypothetical protein
MHYDPIKIEKTKDSLKFYFVDGKIKRWFYEIWGIKNKKDIDSWDEHLSKKMWYSQEVRKETLILMGQLK